jgi:hypothetical protein
MYFLEKKIVSQTSFQFLKTKKKKLKAKNKQLKQKKKIILNDPYL